MEEQAVVQVRLVQIADSEMLQKNCFSRDTVEQTRQRIESQLQQYQAGEYVPVVAELAGELIGYSVLRRNGHPLCRHRAELVDVIVRRDLRGRGIARALVEYLRDQARS